MYKPINLRYLQYIIVALFLILTFSLFKLQIIEGKKYNSIAENNIVRIKSVLPVRGEIFDRKFRPIALNRSSLNIYVTPGQIEDKNKLIEFISTNFEISAESIRQALYENRFRLYQEILLVQNVEYESLVKVLESFNYYPSLSYKTEAIRQYAYPNHFTGYLGRINEAEYKEHKEDGYTINSFLGKSGVEKYYEEILRGQNGYRIIQVDASGQDLHLFKHNLDQSAEDGADLILTIDNDLQGFINSIFPEKMKGAVVVMDTQTGGILAYVSYPEFDQNIFSENISNADWNAILNNPDKPMLDRNIHGAYPPGSIFKPVIASLGLESAIIDRDTKLASCSGGMQVGDRYFKCWWEKGHGSLNVTDAIKVSCDVFFYDLSLKFNLAQINDFCKKCLVTTKNGIDLPGERTGFFPTREWYIENYGKYAPIIGLKVNLAIGQGEVLVTPLQMCAYYAALANDGKWYRPHLLEKSIAGNKTKMNEVESIDFPMSASNLALIKEALWKVINEKYGTGTAASVAGLDVYGKTGSAENHMGNETHSWFAGFAQNDNFSVACVVFVENAGHGGSISAPIAGRIFQYYHEQSK
ncbi:MAG TPA: penicillin-binding protein 2 [Candidatus Cloacimonadota bacterium]|nr:penicillin-binding protein 2 [Candidatus Cloacimonadota bacterium]